MKNDLTGILETGLKGWPMPNGGCECYPECRNDCPDWRQCYDRMPEYWSATYALAKLEAVERALTESTTAIQERA